MEENGPFLLARMQGLGHLVKRVRQRAQLARALRGYPFLIMALRDNFRLRLQLRQRANEETTQQHRG